MKNFQASRNFWNNLQTLSTDLFLSVWPKFLNFVTWEQEPIYSKTFVTLKSYLGGNINRIRTVLGTWVLNVHFVPNTLFYDNNYICSPIISMNMILLNSIALLALNILSTLIKKSDIYNDFRLFLTSHICHSKNLGLVSELKKEMVILNWIQ